MSTPQVTAPAGLPDGGHPGRCPSRPRPDSHGPARAMRTLAGSTAVTAAGLILAGCGITIASQPTAALVRTSESAAAPSVLVVVIDPASPSALAAARDLVSATARPRERLLILDAHSGAFLTAATGPPALSISLPRPPGRLPSGSTSYQKAQHIKAARQYHSAVRRAKTELRQRQHELQANWARSVIGRLATRTSRTEPPQTSIQAALTTASADLFSLREAGINANTHAVIAIMAPPASTAVAMPALPADLQGVTIVISNFPGSSTDQAAWQGGLMQAGAGRVVVLSPATQSQLYPVVRQGLDGAVTDTLSSVLFPPGKYQLQPGATPQLNRLLHLLTVTYPTATASIDGYTDSVPTSTPGGNPELSRLRAQAVEAWLAAHGVAAGRMQAAGYGDADPLAPNTPHGQPLNRRVVVIIDPATGN
jgi:outer membrane protein OmpA-like peptidoglycan-associated protein